MARCVNVGEAVGVIAAQSIGEPGTQLTMRTFHVGGAASRAAAASGVEAKSAGSIRFAGNMRYVSNAKGEKIVIARSAELVVADDMGRERERHKLPYGAMLLVDDGAAVKAGTQLATWDPHTRPIVTEYAGTVKFENVEEGVTVAKQIDEVTGLSTLVVIDAKRRSTTGSTKGVRPQVKLFDESGEEVKIAGTEHCGGDHLPGRLADHREGRPADQRRRHPGAYPAGIGEDPRHHRRSAARGRAVRSACAQGCRHARRVHRHGVASARRPRASSAW